MKDERQQLDAIRKYILKNWSWEWSSYMNSLKPMQLRAFLLSAKVDVFTDAL